MSISCSDGAPGGTLRVFVTRTFALSAVRESTWLAELPLARRAALEARSDLRSHHESLLATRLLQVALADARLPTSLDSLAYDADGAPSLTQPIEFSLSHGGGLVGCVLSTSGSIGLDLEAVGPWQADAFRLYLSDAERVWAGSSERRFADIWTRKEAVAKAARSSGLRRLPDIDTSRSTAIAWLDGIAWHTQRLPLGGSVAGHVATRTAPAQLDLVRVTRDALDTVTAPSRRSAAS